MIFFLANTFFKAEILIHNRMSMPRDTWYYVEVFLMLKSEQAARPGACVDVGVSLCLPFFLEKPTPGLYECIWVSS